MEHALSSPRAATTAAAAAATPATPAPNPITLPASPPPPSPPAPSPSTPSSSWQLAHLSGRLCELTNSGATPQLSLSLTLLRQAQSEGQPCAWIRASQGLFHAPDAEAVGLDLAALPVVHAPNTVAAARAADHLLRSGAFGVVVLDLGTDADLPTAMQARLAGLARHHQSVLLCLTSRAVGRRMRPGGRTSGNTLGSMVSLRAEGRVERAESGLFRCQLNITKDKRHGPGRTHEELRRGPAGLC